MSTLLYTNKLIYGMPVRSSEFRVERFQTDSYSIRASVGLNPVETQYTLEWSNLSLAEVQALSAQLNGAASNTISWQPDDATGAQKFTCINYSLNQHPGPNATWALMATLRREYDL